MQLADLLDSVHYITNPQGKKTGVLLDLEVWQGLLQLVEQTTTDEREFTPEQKQANGKDDKSDGVSKREAAMRREEAAFRKLHPSLYKQYADQYVAIYNEQLIDSDTDQVALYCRVRQQHPGEFVWIAPVNESPDEVLTFRSPRFLTDQS